MPSILRVENANQLCSVLILPSLKKGKILTTYYIALWLNSKLLEIVTHPNPLRSFIFKHIQDLLNQCKDYTDHRALE